MTAIILLIGPRAGKGNALSLAVSEEMMIDELAAVVRVQPQQGKGQTLAQPMNRTTNTILTFPPYSNTFRPTTGYVYCREGCQIEALDTVTAVMHQVNF